ncbi:hypothetical protein D1825_16050 [Cellulomonas rhizosphaerae]|uniref:Uncharacterized protein n=1 Tax=Cellulomonas rhizosphaerae TaxID=2293719 RepID=A0A413RHS6_9CELL|nr:hypothetical protein D1825_16050 [Cellulomonas rhizosphaerae]
MGKGKRPDYPPICMLAVLMASTLYGGDATVIRELSCYGAFLWKVCAQHLEEQMDGFLLPDARARRHGGHPLRRQ